MPTLLSGLVRDEFCLFRVSLALGDNAFGHRAQHAGGGGIDVTMVKLPKLLSRSCMEVRR